MFSCKELIIILVAVYLITNVLKDNFQKIGVGVIALFLLLNKTEGITNDNESSSDNTNISGNNVDNKPETKNIEAKDLNMGPYDGLCLSTGNQEYWMKSPDETALVPNDKLYTYFSSQGPIKMKLSNQAALRGPPVDGVKGSAEKMFMLANNVASPLCCPSTFSTSTGCLCTTKNQRDFIASRGYLDEKVDLVESVKKAEI